ncbi:hypothetical protein GCM10010116_38070 [Microbispora rosea subsp. aerata]|nr:hypothetical protein GCM10010116_38070 [Microbispora rosea subsp. aerata]GIH54295.1 hypothetical protein Mro02_12090 [Microbispora rosea subsp. aerata]GLJ81526.1 hypothetical protein GCM10017588_02500 [Microbispora rosea subsp. aerata]
MLPPRTAEGALPAPPKPPRPCSPTPHRRFPSAACGTLGLAREPPPHRRGHAGLLLTGHHPCTAKATMTRSPTPHRRFPSAACGTLGLAREPSPYLPWAASVLIVASDGGPCAAVARRADARDLWGFDGDLRKSAPGALTPAGKVSLT